jgi:CubicO group peptidase (beta-lactamase class C family)
LRIATYFLLLVILDIACNPTAGTSETAEDSLQFYPATPVAMDKGEFRNYYRAVSNFFNNNLVDRGFNGSILIAKNGVVIYEKYVGFNDLRKKDSLTDTSNLHIASTSKPFTAMAILRMVDAGKISLDDTLNKFFPDFPYPGVTVKMLLNHRSGIPNYVYFMSDKKKWDPTQYVTNNDVLNFLYTEKPNKSSSPDTRFSYSNTNYVLLAMIVEKVSGIPFPEYMKKDLFDPLQMKHTYVFTLADTLRATPSFNHDGSFWQNDFLEGTYGDKNVYSTPRDLLKWDQALYSGQLLRQPLLDSAFLPYSQERPSVHNYGLGWRLQILPNGKKIIYHFGRWHGFNAAFARLTDEKATIIILGNKFTRNIYNSAAKSYDLFGNYRRHDHDEETNPGAAAMPVKKRTKKPAR